MKTYEIDVNVASFAKGQVFVVGPAPEIEVRDESPGKIEHALVTWIFHNLSADLTPVITFKSMDVIASGPTTILGPVPKVTFEIRFPSIAMDRCHAGYVISAPSAAAKTAAIPPLEGPLLVVVHSVDPPDGSCVPADSCVPASGRQVQRVA
jgi:hypothetical protein